MTDDTPHKDDDIALAGEYALHLLGTDERQAFEARLVTDPDLRALVTEWEAQFAAFVEDAPEVAPPASIRQALAKTLFTDPDRPRQLPWRRIFAGILVAGALTVAAFVVAPLVRAPLGFIPSHTATLENPERSYVLTARFEAKSDTLVIDRLSGEIPDGRVLELWYIADAESAPVSLGLLTSQRRTELVVGTDIAPTINNGILAVSDEPVGGSPTGAPTGTVLASGTITRL